MLTFLRLTLVVPFGHTPINGNNIWDSIGGVSTSSPAAVSWASSNFRLDVFVRGTDGALWWKNYDNGWSGWQSLGGRLASGTGPAVSSWSEGRLDVFVQGTDGALWHTHWDGTTWSAWESLGGGLTSSPAATKDSNMIDVFVRGTDGAVWQKYWSGTAWSSWKSLGGRLVPNTGPAVSQTPWVIVQGTDRQFWQSSTYGGAHWESVGVAPPEALSASSPGAVSTPANMHTLVIFSSTSRNVLYGIHDVSGLISGWTSAGSPP